MATAALWTARGRIGGTGRLVLGAAGTWLAWNALSLAWAPDPSLAWLATNRAAIFACAIAVGVATAALCAPFARRVFVPAMTVGAALPVGVALMAVSVPGVAEATDDGRLTFPAGHPNVLALLAVFMLPGALATFRYARPTRVRWAPALVTAACVVLALTGSRGGIAVGVAAAALTIAASRCPARSMVRAVVGAACAIPAAWVGLGSSELVRGGASTAERILFVALWIGGVGAASWLSPQCERRIGERPRGRRPIRAVALAVGVLACATPAFVLVTSPDLHGCKITSLSDNSSNRVTDVSANQRGAWWCEAIRGWKAAPIVGNGAGSFPVVELRERTTSDDGLSTRDPHGMWVETASALGVVGVAIVAFMWFTAGVQSARKWGDLPAGLVAIPAAAFGQAQADWVLSWPAALVPAGIALGLISGGQGTRKIGRPRAEIAVGVALALALVAATVSAWLPTIAERVRLQAEDALFLRDDTAEAYRLANRASALNPLAAEPILLRATALQVAGHPDRAHAAYEAAARLQPDNPDVWMQYAKALVRAADREGAARAWAQVARLNPHSRELANWRVTQR